MSTAQHNGAAAKPDAEFFSLRGRYSIDPKTTPEALAEDAMCLLSSGLDALKSMDIPGTIGGSEGNAVHCSLYVLRQALANVERLHDMLETAKRQSAGAAL